jgi:hypothetical protein
MVSLPINPTDGRSITTNNGEYNMTKLVISTDTLKANRPEILSKKDLFMWQAPSFNFDLNADEILAKALEVGFVTEVSEDQYVVNDNYVSKYDRGE